MTGFAKSADLSFDLDFLFAKIQQQSDRFSGGDKIVHHLGVMGLVETPDGFQLDDDGVFDNNIGDEIANDDSFIFGLDGLLCRRMQTAPFKLNHHALFINEFEKPEAHLVVHAKGATDHLLCQGFKSHHLVRMRVTFRSLPRQTPLPYEPPTPYPSGHY